ncbi:bifunctional phosphopantothenoylcysteine decarboxylase/phosphopantothenate synthase [Gemmata obscuriglobus]|uniref:Bifunctional phosphopantothenoylcysteine decarboxylase/phosphopantothenate synthase n=1 Tax=Gemmata obscuriglobus TaxID=114 RepID=A0A2Z3HD24_9BACT|nr:phosphopantothenoylcysteine decarboxylase [Gemmata obscuriglobus]AWM39584.1 bifunctional phosphopantothenoylcysteine decarboxylase/phosphopantothenate synthase [Gemmata obscuriglobus]QEG27319.1 bifunctional phosphopantothenoylcysteine decarboxylase/phosphopantothenate synthase [Gemmata obscuriglobus]VTS04153.1 Phosphopantothenoylcysteine synthetase OS=Catellicoccus marimammalium M35/04/3 GN=C683_0479 PE=4 SV=1: DFP [Gemmata obscuriglobus UQM 2246]
MRVLISAGNTVVPIDPLRCIGTVFRGRTGANIALEAHRRGHSVHLLTSAPDVLRPSDVPRDRWVTEQYRTFDELHNAMARTLTNNETDAFIHSAAVSDYRIAGAYTPASGVPFHPESQPQGNDSGLTCVPTDAPEVWLRLVPTPKLVNLVRTPWGFSGVLVKFKLEVGADEQQLLETAEASRVQSRADLVVANTLSGLTFVGPVRGAYRRLRSRRELATRLLDAVEGLAAERAGGAS